MIKNTNVEYKISLYPSKFLGYQSKKGNEGMVKIFISTIWKESHDNFYEFLLYLDYITLIERICLERAFQKIKMKDRCEVYTEKIDEDITMEYACKMEYVAYKMFFVDNNE